MDQALTKDQIVEVATRLFAGLGYDMTSLELIADAVGAPRSSIEELTGGKRELYLTVMERVFEAKRVEIQAAVDGAASEYEAAHRIADAYLDFYARDPQLLALWRHRWVSDAAELTDIEDRFMRPLLRLAARKVRNVVPEDLGPHAFLGAVLWNINGFLGTGLLAPERGMKGSEDREALKQFRAVLHIVIDRLLAPPPGSAQASGAAWTRVPST